MIPATGPQSDGGRIGFHMLSMFERLRAMKSFGLVSVAVGLVLGAGSVSCAAASEAVESASGMVVTSQHDASEVGAEVLRKGGNAIDAAVAVGYALAVTLPCCGNIGGGGFMLIHQADGTNRFLNFRERAPLGATPDMYLDANRNPIPEESRAGWLAVGTPGTVLGLETALNNYGTFTRAKVMAPAVRLAEDGFVLQEAEVEVINEGVTAAPSGSSVRRIFSNHGKPLAAGDRLIQPDLAATLRRLSVEGAQSFYHGANADEVSQAVEAGGGRLRKADFESYAVAHGAPVSCNYRGYQVLSAPPPSSGGVTICEMLNILSGYPLAEFGYRSAAEVHVMTEAMRRGYFDRNNVLGDPAFVTNPVDRLTSLAYADQVRVRIDPHRATPSASLGAATITPEHANTTHYSIVDRWGNAVAVTYTINNNMGAKVIAGRTGYLLNDEMDDFTAKPGAPNLWGLVQGNANAIAPGKQPLSSMAPTMVLKDGKPVLIVGAPGGARILSTILEILVAVIDHQIPLQQAVDAPRFHHQWLPDVLQVEPGAITPQVAQALEAMGHKLAPLPVWSAGNAAEVIGLSPQDLASARALGFAHANVAIGANDRRTPAGAAVVP